MTSSADNPFTLQVLQDLFTNHELLLREAHRPGPQSPNSVKKVGIVGGGTAGWFTALALRAQLPWLEVSVIETPTIPIIGVGEASVPSLVSFLHHYLKIDILEFTKEVKPTWKQGIRFEWGLPGDYAFMAPFDWEVNGIGMLGSMAESGNINDFTLQSILMARNLTPILRINGKLQSYLPLLAFAYHLDNPSLVKYLSKTAIARGVKNLNHKIVDAPLRQSPESSSDSAEPHIDHLLTEDGQKLEFDLYIDCSGFGSYLLGQKLKTKYNSYSSTLYTDSAIAFNAPHNGHIKPYTTAKTMKNGWCWDIPMVQDDHLGYVFSSAFCSVDEAMAEAKALWPDMVGERLVKFRSGRHENMWVGNVFAIGNSYAFVEPLESTGLLMITRAVTSLVRSFPIDTSSPNHKVIKQWVNSNSGKDWDRLRWFLAAHYKFNKKVDSKFWTEARQTMDTSGIDDAIALFQACGPLSLQPRAIRTNLNETNGIFFYGLHGLDCILLGQKVPHVALDREPTEVWSKRYQTALEFAKRALPQSEALDATWARPEWLKALVENPAGWVAKMAPYL